MTNYAHTTFGRLETEERNLKSSKNEGMMKTKARNSLKRQSDTKVQLSFVIRSQWREDKKSLTWRSGLLLFKAFHHERKPKSIKSANRGPIVQNSEVPSDKPPQRSVWGNVYPRSNGPAVRTAGGDVAEYSRSFYSVLRSLVTSINRYRGLRNQLPFISLLHS